MHRVFVCLLLIAIGVADAAQVVDAKSTLDAKVPPWLKQYNVPSVAIAYVQDGVLAWTAAYGEQSRGVSATTNTLYTRRTTKVHKGFVNLGDLCGFVVK